MSRYYRAILALLIALLTPQGAWCAESDNALGIFGNANMDDTIDDRDISYVEGVIKGTNAATNLSDANYDGIVDEKDISQIKAIMDGAETELTVVSESPWDTYQAVTIQKPVKSVLARFFDSAEVLRILNSADKITAVGCKNFIENSAFFPELCNLPYVSDTRTSELDCEATLRMHPDIFLAWYKEERDKLPGICMVHSKLWGLNSTKDIKKLGYIFDRENEAEEYIEWHDDCINRINEQVGKIPKDQRPRVLVTLLEPGGVFGVYKGSGGTNGMDDLMTMIPMNSMGEILPKYTEVDTEWVIDQNPDIIIIASNVGEGESKGGSFAGYDLDKPSQIVSEREEFLNRPELANVNAVKSGKVYMMEYKLFSYSQSMIIGAVYLAKWIYPDLDLNPEEVHQEYLTRFQHLDFNLNEHGIFAYPPIEIDGGLAGIPDKYKDRI